jgi:hypothetical protein
MHVAFRRAKNNGVLPLVFVALPTVQQPCSRSSGIQCLAVPAVQSAQCVQCYQQLHQIPQRRYGDLW